MASLEKEHESHELEFLENAFEACDESDAVSSTVIAFERDSSIPPKYVLSDTPPHQPTAERVLRCEKVSSTWGRDVDKERSTPHITNGISTLLTFEADKMSKMKHVDGKMIHKFDKALFKIIGEYSFEVLKYSDLQILAKFKSTNAYESFGKKFMNGEIEKINGFMLIEIKVVSIVTPYPCYLEVLCTASDGPKLQADLSSLLVSYCSRFSCISIREPIEKGVHNTCSTDVPATDDDKLPAINMMMMFTSKAQRNADKLIQAIKMSKGYWKELYLSKEFSESGEVFFKYSNIPGMLISVLQDSPFAGIKIVLYVNKNFDEMEKFYTFITGKSPFVSDKTEDGLSYRTYSLSRKLELQLVFNAKLMVHHVQNVNLCIAIDDKLISKVLSGISGGVCNLGEKHWKVSDPEGNSLILYSLLRV